MTTIVNNPPVESSNGGISVLIGILVGAIFIIFLVWYLVPIIRNTRTTTTITLTPGTTTPPPAPTPAVNLTFPSGSSSQ